MYSLNTDSYTLWELSMCMKCPWSDLNYASIIVLCYLCFCIFICKFSLDVITSCMTSVCDLMTVLTQNLCKADLFMLTELICDPNTSRLLDVRSNKKLGDLYVLPQLS